MTCPICNFYNLEIQRTKMSGNTKLKQLVEAELTEHKKLNHEDNRLTFSIGWFNLFGNGQVE